MTEIEVKGLVIRSTDVKESDRIITIFTEEMGVVSAVARGARSLKSRKLSSTMLFCYSSFILKKQKEYFYVKEAELIENFFDIRRSIERLALAGYIAEVLSDVTVAEAERDLLRLSLNSLFAISEGKASLEKIKAAFEIRAASILGFMPDVLSCSECGGKSGDFYFDIMGGSILCYECNLRRVKMHAQPENPHESKIISLLSETAKAALGYCIHCPLEKLLSFNIPEADMNIFSRAAEDYLLNQLERSYKTLDFYKEVAPRK